MDLENPRKDGRSLYTLIALRLIWCVGRTLFVMRSGIRDAQEDFATGYGGQQVCDLFEEEGITELFPALFPKK